VSPSTAKPGAPPGLPARDALAILSHPVVGACMAIVLYAAAAAVCTFPLVLHVSDALLPTPDPLHESWIIAWDIHALSTNPLHLYDGNTYFPFPLPLTYADAMLSGALTVAPVLWLTGNAIVAHNVLTLTALIVAGVGTYLLVRALTGNNAGGLVAGLIFAFAASRQGHLDHVNLLQLGWLPLALLFLHRALERGRTLDLLLLAFFTACQALASFYLAFMMAVTYAVFIAVELVWRRSSWKIDNMARVAGALLLAGIVVVPILLPYARTQQIYQFNWPTDVIGDLSAVPTDYLSVPPQNVLYSPLLDQFSNGMFANEHTLFPGLTALALALIALATRSRGIEIIRYFLVGAVAFVLSFGPYVRFGDLTVSLPYLYLLRFVPGFGVMRAPARFDFIVMLALAVLAGFGVARISQALSGSARTIVRRSIVVCVGLATVLELVPHPLPIAAVQVGADVPPVYAWLRSQDANAVVAEIPSGEQPGDTSPPYEYMSTYHWHPLVNGNGNGFEPPAYKQVVSELDAFPDPSAVEHLRSLGVRYLIAHTNNLRDNERQLLADANLAKLQLGIVATFGGDVVYEFAQLPNQPSLQDHVQLELPSMVGRGATPFVTLRLTNDSTHPLLAGVPGALRIQTEWNHHAGKTTTVQDAPLFLEPDDDLQLQFPAELSSDVAGADSAELTVRLTGAVQLEATRTVRIADLPTSTDRTELSASLGPVQFLPLVRTDTQIPIDVTVRNTGGAIWLADLPGSKGTTGVVGVSVKSWTSADGATFPVSDNSSAHVDWNVNPGQATTVTIHTMTPHVPGRYNVVLDAVSENVTWFADVNAGTQLVVPVDVQP
jgi:hypothetical protein